MVFKVLTVLCATLAFARAGLLAAPAVAYSPANEVSHVYSSIGAVSHQPLVAQGLEPFSFSDQSTQKCKTEKALSKI